MSTFPPFPNFIEMLNKKFTVKDQKIWRFSEKHNKDRIGLTEK